MRKIKGFKSCQIETIQYLCFFGILFLVSPLLLFGVASLLLFFGSHKQWRAAITGISISIASFAMYVEPISGDLIRYYATLDIISDYSLKEVVEYCRDGLYVENFLYWLVCRTGINGFLPAISTSVTYFVAMYITGKTASTYNEEKNIKWIIVLQLLILPFFSIVHNVRNVLAFSLGLLAIFRDGFLKKRGIFTFLLYIIPCFIHVTAILIVLLRVFLLIFREKTYFAICVLFVGLGSAIKIGYKYIQFFSFIPAIQRLIAKGYYYFNDANTAYGQEVANSAYYNMLKLLFFIHVVIIICVVLSRRHRLRAIDSSCMFVWNRFIFCTCAAVLFACVQYTTPAYWRFYIILSCMLATVFFPFDKSKKETIFSNKYLILFCLGVAISLCHIYSAVSNYNLFYWIEQVMFNKELNLLRTLLC